MSPTPDDWLLPGEPDPSAGASAADRHRQLAQEARHSSHGVPLGDLLGPIRAPEPTPTSNWRRGAAAERRTSQVLAPLGLAGWAVIHDRRVPGSNANIDHLVIGPTGVWVIDTKAYRGRIKVLGDRRLWYGRTCLDDVLRVARWLAMRVGQILADAWADAPSVSRALLCIHGARLPCDPMHWRGVSLASPAMLVDLIAGSAGVLDRSAAEVLAGAATELLLPAMTTRR